ncbi:MAG: hypothetical protein WA446_02815 [Steroidobacteraceae bacterium]|jgi:hypothetical protein
MNLLKLLWLVVAVTLVVPAVAQTSASGKATTTGDSASMNMQILRDKVRADKKLVVAQNMQLTDSEASAFWPIYEAYQTDLGKINERMKKVILAYADAYNSGPVTNEVAKKLLEDWLGTQEADVQLMRSYVPKFEKALPDVKVARYIQIESKIRAIVRYELDSQIPLVE